MRQAEEEMRVLYVALTRAREKLVITNVSERLMFGRTSINRMSRFLKEIPATLIYNVNDEMKVKQMKAFASSFSNTSSNTPKKPEKPKTSHDAFNVGEVVIHPIFGEGLVTLKKPMGGDTLYEISFDNVGTKKLMGTYARLKKKS